MKFIFIAAEGQSVLEVHLFTRFRQLIRSPVSDDVVGFIIDGISTSSTLPFAPVAFG